MCLARVDKRKKHTDTNIGYKVFRRGSYLHKGKHLTGIYWGSDDKYSLKKEYIARGVSEGDRYSPIGFHIFLTINSAKVWLDVHGGTGIWRLQYSGVVASGNDVCRNLPVVIAQRMTILRKVA